MLKKWKCPKCRRVITKYSTICQYPDCDGKRGFFPWLLNIDNPFLWMWVCVIALIVWVVLS